MLKQSKRAEDLRSWRKSSARVVAVFIILRRAGHQLHRLAEQQEAEVRENQPLERVLTWVQVLPW
jgi:hypothetical protein